MGPDLRLRMPGLIWGMRGINFNESFIAYQKVATEAA